MVWSQDGLAQFMQRRRMMNYLNGTQAWDPSLSTTNTLPRVAVGAPSPEQQAQVQQQALQDRMNLTDSTYGQINPQQQSDYLTQAENMIFKANQIQSHAAQVRLQTSIPQTIFSTDVQQSGNGGYPQATPMPYKGKHPPQVTPMPNVPKGYNAFEHAIQMKESGGNYGVVNHDSGALGKYQIMPGNIAGPGGWDMEALGRNITPQAFLSHPKLQEAIAQFKLRQYYNKYGPAGAASAWYSGNPNAWKNSYAAQGAYPSIHAYVQSILNAMG